MSPHLEHRRGMALAITVFALVIVTALVAGTFYAATLARRVSDSGRRAVAAFGAAEAGITDVVTNWSPAALDGLAPYPDTSYAIASAAAMAATPGGAGRYYGRVYRLNGDLFLVDVTGRDNEPGGAGPAGAGAPRERVGVVVKLRPVDFGLSAALTTRTGATPSGAATADRADSIPPGWACPPADPAVEDSRPAGRLARVDSLSAELAARATVTLPGGTYRTQPSYRGSACDVTDSLDWGDGQGGGVCAAYFPIVHVTGDATLEGGQGQGILLVDGDLTLKGAYRFYGVVIVKGAIGGAGGGATGARIYGAAVARDAGGVGLVYSSCAVGTVSTRAALASLLRSRSWVPLD